MRFWKVIWLAVGLGCASAAAAANAKIIKVLPHHLDLQGRHALSPSLYERDAYQAILRKNPALCSGLRFDVQWKIKQAPAAELKLRAELITRHGPKEAPLVLEQAVSAKPGRSRWSSLTLTGEAFRQAGEVVAWRVTLWERDQLRAEQKSFLW